MANFIRFIYFFLTFRQVHVEILNQTIKLERVDFLIAPSSYREAFHLEEATRFFYWTKTA